MFQVTLRAKTSVNNLSQYLRKLQTMSLDHYSRIDLTKVQTTCRNTMKLFPLGKKSMQKVIIGDESGTIQSFGIKKGYVNVCSRTNNSD